MRKKANLRASLESALKTKRDENGMVDVIKAERLRVFRSCPLSTPESASSSLQMLAIARYGCALRLDLPLSGGLLGHARKTLSL
ncbi:hypothetical protein [Massilia glaciei]|uniref:hypothetical protein n=1 Tax=Massilia glaciei TaxID=1524097 RepID=UPI0015E7F45E|nr:hypothetical protein [Massilia glaciei]